MSPDLGAPSFLNTRLFQFAQSFFEVNGRQHAVVRVLAFGIVEQLDVFKDVPPCLISRSIFVPSDFFSPQELKEALGHSVVMTIAATRHSMRTGCCKTSTSAVQPL